MSSSFPILPVDSTSDDEFVPPENGLTICAVADDEPETGLTICAEADDRYGQRSHYFLNRGELTEWKFCLEIHSRKLRIATPTSAYLPFDRFVFSRRSCYRVQIKFTSKRRGHWYVVGLPRLYRRGDFDFLAVLTPQEDWFILPFEEIRGKQAIWLPARKNDRQRKFQEYRNAWEVFE
jgi:hypothetical protein